MNVASVFASPAGTPNPTRPSARAASHVSYALRQASVSGLDPGTESSVIIVTGRPSVKRDSRISLAKCSAIVDTHSRAVPLAIRVRSMMVAISVAHSLTASVATCSFPGKRK